MLISYIHIANPTTSRTYDTKRALKNNSFINMSQQAFDEIEQHRFAKDKEKGVILSYHIIEETKANENKN